jgi:CHAD domain-containing protein
VRDLDVLIGTLGGPSKRVGAGPDRGDLEPLRQAWDHERRRAARRLTAELGRRRFDRSLKHASTFVRSSGTARRDQPDGSEVPRVAHRAPALIWDAFGEVLAFDVDPETADLPAIHQTRIAAKKLRYTIEAFDGALASAATLIKQVTALQDSAGKMHDAIVARDRARSFLDSADVGDGERRAIRQFAMVQDRRAKGMRATVARRLATVRGRAFRRSLDRAIVAMGA